MGAKFSMDDYIDVAERLQDFKDAHRDGSLQIIRWESVAVGDKTFIVCECAAYRTPDDERPGHGIAWEPFPGETNYTRNSELMNAHTAAMGRAIVALGLTANRKLASRQEVRARQEEAEQREGAGSEQAAPKASATKPKPKPVGPTPAQLDELRELAKASGCDARGLAMLLVSVDALKGARFDALETPAEQKAELARAMQALKPEALATVKSTLEEWVAQKAASDAA